MNATEVVPPPLCAACGQPVTHTTTWFPMVDDVRHLAERSHPCECVTVDVPLVPVHTGVINPDEDVDALAEAWHRIGAAAEWIDQNGDQAAAVAALIDDVLAVVGTPVIGAASSERVRLITEHAERTP